VQERSARNAVLLGVAVGGAAVLLTCLCGTGVVGVILAARGPAQPDQFVGAWKGRFTLHGQPTDVIYRFEKSGRLHEEDYDPQGRLLHVGGGQWRFRGGRIIIDFERGTEVAEAILADDNTINYRIINHTDLAQVGLTTTFRRQ
jgi:hypothetical protein